MAAALEPGAMEEFRFEAEIRLGLGLRVGVGVGLPSGDGRSLLCTWHAATLAPEGSRLGLGALLGLGLGSGLGLGLG